MRCFYVGDSDIAKWPFPQPSFSVTKEGWTSFQIQHELKRSVEWETEMATDEPFIVVCCWGENDLSTCPTDTAVVKLAARNVSESVSYLGDRMGGGFRGLLFIGPKLEPWMFADPLNVDMDSIVSYVRLSLELKSVLGAIPLATFVDALAMFTDQAGKTSEEIRDEVQRLRLASTVTSEDSFSFKVDDRFFLSDQLHLSEDGYDIWNDIVESFAQEKEQEG
mmetsp:Transcript_21705/g.45214  ORF Transcript_21705/g.45214 Transcript_21705/m.45214 type:complete len:221 (-) Transcript_21705:11-673(-)